MGKLEKAKFIGLVFLYGAKSQLNDELTISAAASVGLMQGLKYKGNIKTGIKAGVATLAVFMAANGLNNVVGNWDKIKEL